MYISIYVFVYFKDTVYPFFESDTLFLESCACVVFRCFAIFESRDV